MGIKILSLHMIPKCFPLMGNRISCKQPFPTQPKGTIKLIKCDGIVKIYNRPISVSELMEEFPKYMVCPCDSFYIGQKIPSLSVHEKLQLGQNYLLLPIQLLQSVFSFGCLLQCQTKNAFLKKSPTCQPFDIQKTPSGTLRIRVSEEFIAHLMEHDTDHDDDQQPRLAKKIGVCTTPQLQKDYQQLVGQRQWKPKLDTIAERHHKRRKVKISTFVIRKKQKVQPNISQWHKKLGDRSRDIIFKH